MEKRQNFSKEDLHTLRKITAKRNFGHPIYLHDILEFILIVGKYGIKGFKHKPLGLCKAINYTLHYIDCSKKSSFECCPYNKYSPYVPCLFKKSFIIGIKSTLKKFYKNQACINPDDQWYWWEPNNWEVRTTFIKSVIKDTENVMVYDGKCYRLFHQSKCIKSKK